MKDWLGNSKSIYTTLGASNHTDKERQEHDFYATDPIAIERLLEKEHFSHYVWECACGAGHLSKVLIEHGFDVKNTDLFDRGFSNTQVKDFLQITRQDIENDASRDIITNPPYKYAKEFVEHAIDISKENTKIAMFLKLQFLEGQGRLSMFKKYPPKTIYVFSKRVVCAKNGDFESVSSSAVAYAWFIWLKGFRGDPTIKWI